MFRRNKVSAHSVQHRHAGPPQASAAASSAANLAFQKSNPSLSAAAAAAAIRANPHPPTDVGNVQTKRLQRRESGSSTTGSPRPGLERRTSLTDRSLRSPSPGRDAGSRPPTATATAPPMPPLPQGMERTPSGRHRAASLEAPQRIASPPPSHPGGRGMSLDRAPRSPVVAKTASTPKPKPKLPKLNEQADTTPRTSVNFSRPMSPPPKSPTSPTPVSPTNGQTGWFAGPVVSGGQPRQELDSLEPKSATVLPAAGVSGIQAGLQGVADQPVKKKKKRKVAAAGGNTGSHLSQGTMELTGTAVEPTRAALAAAAASSSPVSAEEASPSVHRSRRASSESDRSSITYVEQPEQAKTRVGAILARQPSLIDEAPEYEPTPERANTGRKVEALPTTVKSPLDASRVAATSTPEPQPAPAVQPIETAVAEPPETFHQPNGGAVQRTSSLSPQRAARFSPKPVEYLGGIQHQPLGRSASPAKSALKHSPSSSVRTASPDVKFAAPPASDVSESSAARKKSNRVSFDETPIIVSGLQTSRYASQSPPGARDLDEELEDIMKPRPALPSFGSVRGRHTKDEDVPSPAGTTNTTVAGHSSDHSVGGILAQDFASRAQTQQHDANAPLAPEVTTVEGTGYASDSESEYSEHPSYNQTPQTHTPQAKLPNEMSKHEPETIAEAVASFQESSYVVPPVAATLNGTAKHTTVEPVPEPVSEPIVETPTIAIQPATPAAEEERKELAMPGSFPGAWDDDVEAQAAPQPSKGTTPTAVPQTRAIPAETSRQTHGIPAALRIEDESETESDTSSIWSDAEEDFPSGPGGFASLNAIVDSPKVVDAPAPGLAVSKHAPASGEAAPPSPTAAQWNDATAYWRGLSDQKKRELEQQAVLKEAGLQESESSGEEETSDDEEEEEEVEKPKVVQPVRPSTPPQQKPKKQPQLESPIAFSKNEAVAQPAKIKKEPKLRSSMRQSQLSSDDEAPPTRMKTSLRSSAKQQPTPTSRASTAGGHHFRSSMRGPQPPRPDPVRRHSSGLEDSKWSQEKPAAQQAAAVVQNGRPRSAISASPAPKSALKKTGQPVAAPAPVPAPTLRRQDSDDSVSSFRRQRAGKYEGGMTMRRSMREAQAPAAAPAPRVSEQPQSPPEKKRGGLFRLRSLSPAGRQPQQQASQIRTSLRPGSSGGQPTAPTIRTQEPSLPKKASRFKSPTRLGFGKSKPKSPQSPASVAPAPAPVASSPRYKSRISADSDDDEVPRANFVSRFADSDDEADSPQLTKSLTPVRGIPRQNREDDEDSTDLEDSDNERAKKMPPVPSLKDIDSAHGQRTSPKAMTNGARPASILSAGSLRKGKSGANDGGLAASRFAGPTPPVPALPASPAPVERSQQKRRLSWLGMGGSKRRSSSMPPPSITSPPPSRDNDAAPAKPNLLRRSTPTGLPQISEDTASTNGNWPLASPADERPSTADGPGALLSKGTLRPDVGKRRSTADYVGSERPLGLTTTIEAGSVDGDSEAGRGRKRVGFNFESGEPVYSERTGRKKKFGTLRKMFGLHD